MKRSFLALHRRCCQVIEAGSCEPALVDELYADLVRVAIAVDRSAMFSKNEELDDISTETLAYLYVDYLQGKILTLYSDRKRRRRMLERANAMLEKFLSRCESLRLMHGNRDVFAADEVRIRMRRRHACFECAILMSNGLCVGKAGRAEPEREAPAQDCSVSLPERSAGAY